MKKTLITIAATALLFGGTTAFAATNSVSVEQLIAQLQTQIASLTTQLAALKAAQSTVVASQDSIGTTLKLIGDLKEGMTGEQVTLLQTALAADPAIYPEGLITGYYGKRTTQAIYRFQKKNGLELTGKFERKTMEHLNKLLENSRITREDGERDNEKSHFCIPPGHTIAPGWLMKARGSQGNGHGNGNKSTSDDQLIPLCNNKNGSTTPSTSDTTAPVISALAVSGISMNTATITWATNESANGTIFMSTISPVATATAVWTQGSFTTTHTAILSGLTANTPYYYIVRSMDAAGNATYTTQSSFITSSIPDTTAPIITLLSATPTSSTTATVSWATNEAASSKVYFGATSPLITASALNAFDGTLVTTHQLSLSGLSTSTRYYTVVESRDAANTIATSSEVTFVTPAL